MYKMDTQVGVLGCLQVSQTVGNFQKAVYFRRRSQGYVDVADTFSLPRFAEPFCQVGRDRNSRPAELLDEAKALRLGKGCRGLVESQAAGQGPIVGVIPTKIAHGEEPYGLRCCSW